MGYEVKSDERKTCGAGGSGGREELEMIRVCVGGKRLVKG